MAKKHKRRQRKTKGRQTTLAQQPRPEPTSKPKDGQSQNNASGNQAARSSTITDSLSHLTHADDTPTTYLIRIAAVNLDQFVFDTEDLSTIRGGGVLLLEWPEKLKGEDELTQKPAELAALSQEDWKVITEAKKRWEFITEGASSALIKTTLDPAIARECLRAAFDAWFRCHATYRYATFGVDVVPAGKNFYDDYQQLIAANRWRQQRESSVPLTSRKCDASTFCAIDAIRPAEKSIKAEAKDLMVCASVAIRREKGKKSRKELDIPEKPDITGGHEDFLDTHLDFNLLTQDAPKNCPRLEHKMAVIYADGNKFTAIENAAARAGSESLTEWDKDIRRKRRQLLNGLSARLQDDCKWYSETEGSKKYRFQTLLWGGDEHIWLVPAWCLRDIVAYFFESTHTWRWQDQRMTHAMSIVLCTADSPIRGVVDLARKLAEAAKHARRRQREIGGQTTMRDAIAYQVLTSFDQLGADHERIRAQFRPPGESEADALLDYAQWQALVTWRDAHDKLNRIIGASRYYAIQRAALAADQLAYEAILARTRQLLGGDLPATFEPGPWPPQGNIPAAEPCLPEPSLYMKWTHLSALKDYLVKSTEPTNACTSR